MAVSGGCLCGAVRYTIDAEPIATRTCWCRLCQYLGAGNGTTSTKFPTEAIRLTGEVRWYDSIADSGNAMTRGFCPTCGTPLFTKAVDAPDVTGVRIGSYDDPALHRPAQVIWTASAPAWAPIDPTLPATGGQPS